MTIVQYKTVVFTWNELRLVGRLLMPSKLQARVSEKFSDSSWDWDETWSCHTRKLNCEGDNIQNYHIYPLCVSADYKRITNNLKRSKFEIEMYQSSQIRTILTPIIHVYDGAIRDFSGHSRSFDEWDHRGVAQQLKSLSLLNKSNKFHRHWPACPSKLEPLSLIILFLVSSLYMTCHDIICEMNIASWNSISINVIPRFVIMFVGKTFFFHHRPLKSINSLSSDFWVTLDNFFFPRTRRN